MTSVTDATDALGASPLGLHVEAARIRLAERPRELTR